jgi:hypothetical protein
MPENHGERGSFDQQGLDEEDDFGREDDFAEEDDFDDDDDDDDDGYEPGEAGRAWSAAGYPSAGFPPPPGRHNTRRGWLFAVTAVVAAALAFGVVDAAIRVASDSPAASAAPSASAPTSGGSGALPSGGAQSGPGAGTAPLPPGAAEHLLVGGKVAAVSATSITLGSGTQTVTAAVTQSTKVTGKVTRISAIKVGDLVSASITGTSGGQLVADAIQDPASLPSGLGQ